MRDSQNEIKAIPQKIFFAKNRHLMDLVDRMDLIAMRGLPVCHSQSAPTKFPQSTIGAFTEFTINKKDITQEPKTLS